MTRLLLPFMFMFVFVFGFAACERAPSSSRAPGPPAAPVQVAANQAAEESVDEAAVAPVGERGPSIYDLPMQLVDAHGTPIHLDVARGHVTLVTMFYGSCAVACPLIISELVQTLDELPPGVREDARVLMVTFDPARDTPERLDQLARERKLDARFTLARPSEGDVRTLAAVLGVKYRKLDDGQFAHGATIVTLDRDGRPIARVDQLGQRATLVRAIVAETAALPRS